MNFQIQKEGSVYEVRLKIQGGLFIVCDAVIVWLDQINNNFF